MSSQPVPEPGRARHAVRGREGNAGSVRMPEAPVLVAGVEDASWLAPDGTVERLGISRARERARGRQVIVCHAPATAARLGAPRLDALDVLELYAFVRPARPAVPTARGLADALGLRAPEDLEEAAGILWQAAAMLLGELPADPEASRSLPALARLLSEAGWAWAPAVHVSLTGEAEPGPAAGARRALEVWHGLPRWQDGPPESRRRSAAVSAEEARRRLALMLGEEAEPRPQQADYASGAAEAFRPREHRDEPNIVLAEAGTGVGKTLGYIAPASVWAEKSGSPVWISTYTRNLQYQVDSELGRLYPTPGEKRGKVVVRKGRENYLCLLNYEEAVAASGLNPRDTLALALLARWAARTRGGDMVAGDFPGWLPDLVGRPPTLGLTDRRGECIHSGCRHYDRCFIERSVREARRARIVIANHALVMIQAALGADEEGLLPAAYVFDEGHHIFDAADSAFAAHLSGAETHELRRWLIGTEGRQGQERLGRGLRRRLEGLIGDEPRPDELVLESLRRARVLPGRGWLQRLGSGREIGVTEGFLALVRRQVLARVADPESPYSLETDPRPLAEGLPEAARRLAAALEALRRPLADLQQWLTRKLDRDAKDLDSETRRHIDALVRSLEHRALRPLAAWTTMLATLEEDTPPEFVDWFGIERIDGRDVDAGMNRHWVDPSLPFAETVLRRSQSALITSATLTDGAEDVEADWLGAEARSGVVHLACRSRRARVPSPFDYAGQTRVFIVNDVRKDRMDQVAAAYRELFLASGGGALGLFTAISRLKAVHGRLAAPLEGADISLYAQHVDAWDTTTLIDIFRAETTSCLLGTDAVRDGIDVPGEALRLIVFDRVPWPRPDIRHRARRAAFGGRVHDDRITRLRVKQAYGRLIRRAADRGVFVLLDPMMPSRLLGAFPEGVGVARVGLAEAVAETRRFFRD